MRQSDPLSDALEAFHLHICLAGSFRLAAPWGFSAPIGVGAVYAIRAGTCWLTAGGAPAVRLDEGDLAIVSCHTGHVLQDIVTSPVSPMQQLIDRSWQRSAGGVATDGTKLFGSLFQFEAGELHPFYSALPPVFRIPREHTAELSWLEPVLRMIVDESTWSRPGAGSIAGRLVEVLLVHIVRRRLEEGLVDCQTSIGALLHPEIGPALGLIHRHPEQPWTVATLAEQVAMSRSAFSAEFTSVAGKPPMRYLREHRMQLASRLLQDRRRGLKEVAARVGYESIAAFSAAFKRWSGEAPAAYRRGAAEE